MKTTAKGKGVFTPFILISLTGCFASCWMFWITACGPGIGSDSIAFIETARSLIAGNGFYHFGKPMTHFPPVYPLLLALGGIFQPGDILPVARILCAIFFGANVALLGFAVFVCTERNLSAVVCIMCIFMTSAPIMAIHLDAMSEAPFITFTLVAFIMLSFYILRPSVYLLISASLSAGLAIATRYVGVTLLPPFVFALLLLDNRPLRRKIINIFLVIAIASFPLALWLGRNILAADTITNRELHVHAVGLSHINDLIYTMSIFVVPKLPPNFRLAELVLSRVVVIVFAFTIFAVIKNRNYIKSNLKSPSIILSFICIMFVLTYIPFIFISISFFDASTGLNPRILSPVFLATVLAVVLVARLLSDKSNKKIVWYGFMSVTVLFVLVNCAKSITAAEDIHNNGEGYTSIRWRNSMTMSIVKTLDNNLIIYTNGRDVIKFYTGKTALVLPVIMNRLTKKNNEYYDKEMRILYDEVVDGKAVVVYFSDINKEHLPSAELIANHDMPVISTLSDGIIYGQSK